MGVFTCLVFVLCCLGRATTTARAVAFEERPQEYVAHEGSYSVSVTPRAAVLNLCGHVFGLSVAGADPASKWEGLDRMPGKANYLLGRAVRRSYELYGQIRRRGVYPGIDWVFRGDQEHLEYDFEIGAGRDAGRIRVEFAGADAVRIDGFGALIVRAGACEIRQPAPVAYQVVAGRRTGVRVAYRMEARDRVGFRIGPYDRTQALVIDPKVVFGSGFGGSGFSSAADIALDAQGNIYVAGETDSADFGVQNGVQNHAGAAPLLVSGDGGQTWAAPSLGASRAVRWMAAAPGMPAVLYAATSAGVMKSADGGTTWTTPANAGLTAVPIAAAVDAGTAATVYAASAGEGVYTSSDGGASWSVSTDGLIVEGSVPPSPAQLSSLRASPTQPGTVFAIARAPDLVYRSMDSGHTWRTVNLPAAGGSPESLAFSPTDAKTLFLGQQTGPLLRSTDGGDTWTSLANEHVVAAQGLAIVPGTPAVLLAAGENGLRRSADGGNTWTTVLALTAGSVAADPRTAGVAYAVDAFGLDRSTDFGQTWTRTALPYELVPVTLLVSPGDSRVFVGESAQRDAFVTKWNADGSRILYSTYLGGSGDDSATGLAVDSAGSVYVTGTTTSPDFPVSKNAFQKTLAGSKGTRAQNAFAAKLSPDGSQLVYATLVGGGGEQSSRIAIDGAGEAVIAGGTNSAMFPVTGGAFQPAPVAGCSIASPFVETSGTAFVSKVAADGGSLVYSTLVGGSCATRAQTVAIDAAGNTWVGGWTDSTDFPVTNDAWQAVPGGYVYDGFLARFTPGGTLAYATYVGGAKYDAVTGLGFDREGNVYVTGTSGGLSQPASPGAFQAQGGVTCVIFSFGPGVYQAVGSAFVLKLDPAAQKTMGLTYLGAPMCLSPSNIAIDAAGEPWIGGALSGYGSAPQTANPFQIGIGRGFVSKFSADFTELLFSTYIDPTAAGIALDSAGLAYVAGEGPISNTTGSAQAYVAKIDAAPPAISLDAVENAVNPASPSNMQGIGPGEVLRIRGKNLGPAKMTAGIINGGVLATTVEGVEVTFDGTAVPLLSVSAGEIDLVAPFALAGKAATTVQVQYQGVKSNQVQVGIAQPVRFVGVLSGVPVQVLGVFNEDFTINSASNPAQAGSVIQLYVSGIGQTDPPSQDGQVNGFPPAALPAPVRMATGGNDLAVTYAGAAPGLAAGIFQINFAAPAESTIVSLAIGQASTEFSVSVR